MVPQRDLDIILSTHASWKKLSGKSVLITGASGRLGIYIAHALVEANKRWDLGMELVLLARSQKKLEDAYGSLLQGSNVHVLLQDVTAPIETLYGIDYIFHTAGLASPEDFTHRPIETLWGHVQGTKNVLDLAVEKKTIRVLYVSTIEIYGTWSKEDGIRETDMGPMSCTNFRACYPEAKRLCETMLACYKQEHGLDYVGVRMSHTLGPGISLEDGRAFAEFLRNVLRGEDITLQSDGSAVRTYTYTADAVGAMFLAMLNGKEEYYNVAAVSNQISIRDLAVLIASLSKAGKTRVRYAESAKAQLAYLPFKLGILDCSKIEALGWKPQADTKQVFQWTLDSLSSTVG